MARTTREESRVDEVEKSSPLSVHLEELRNRLIYSVIYVAAGCVAGFFLSEKYLFTWLLEPILKIPDTNLQVLGPTDKLTAFFKTSFIAGFVLASPFVIHQIWLFLKPGLKPHERRGLLMFIPVSSVLFVAGAAFVFYVMIPAALKFLMGFDLGVDVVMDITLDRYFSFMLLLVLAGGLIFQIPLVTYFLARVGMVSARGMSSNRKYAFLGVVVVSAIVTPTGDMFNLFLLALPMYLLYEISIMIAAVSYRKAASHT